MNAFQPTRECPQGLKPLDLSGFCGTTEQLGEKVIFEVEAKNRKALGCPRNDPRTSGDDFPSPKLTSIHLVFDFFTKL
jgi:hypothetical protein